jgi:hypothetical protein
LGRRMPFTNSLRGQSFRSQLLKDDVDRTLAQIGCPSISQLSPGYVMADGWNDIAQQKS